MRRITRVICTASTMAFVAVGAEEPENKLVTKAFKVAALDVKARRLEVKEGGYEVVWHDTKTKFFQHRSVLLKDMEPGETLYIYGKRHERSGGGKKGGSTDPMITDVEVIGTGKAFRRGAVDAKVTGLAWEEGKLTTKLPFNVEVANQRYRIAGDDRTAAYSLEPLEREKVAGAKVLIRGNARKVTIEQDGKPKDVTRIHATEIHLVELNADHARIFQSQWVERKKEPVKTAAGGKKK